MSGLQVSYKWFSSALPVGYKWYDWVTSCYEWVTSGLGVGYECVTSGLQVGYKWVPSGFQVGYKRVTSGFLKIGYVFGTQHFSLNCEIYMPFQPVLSISTCS